MPNKTLKGLKKCPFCGRLELSVHGYSFVSCGYCQASGPVIYEGTMKKGKENAIKAWNRRSPQQKNRRIDGR